MGRRCSSPHLVSRSQSSAIPSAHWLPVKMAPPTTLLTALHTSYIQSLDTARPLLLVLLSRLTLLPCAETGRDGLPYDGAPANERDLLGFDGALIDGEPGRAAQG